MKQIPFGQRSGFQVTPASIGAMRLPADMDEAVTLVRHAIDSGMHYIDTCRCYGDSELKLAQALKDGYREKVILSTKWSPWNVKIEESDDTSADCMRKRIEESMRRLEVDYLDYYQIWSINSRENYAAAVAKGGMLDGIRKAVDEGLVRHIGFTTHDTEANLLDYIAEADWCEIILFTYNLLNLTYEKAIAAAHAKGIGTIIMNPVAGGLLAHDSHILKPLAKRVGAKTIPELAIRFLISNPNITTMISGIAKVADVDETIAAIDRGPFTSAQMAILHQQLAEIHAVNQGFCTGCRYCLPCPQDIEIPAIMNMIAQSRFWGLKDSSQNRYRDMKTPKAEACIRCGKCEEKCTQHLPIMGEMDYAAKTFEPPQKSKKISRNLSCVARSAKQEGTKSRRSK